MSGFLHTPAHTRLLEAGYLPRVETTRGRSRYWHVVRRQRVVIALTAGVTVVCGFLLTLTESRTYQSTTTIKVENVNEYSTGTRAEKTSAETGSRGVDEEVQTAVRMLQSRALRERVRAEMWQQTPSEALQPTDLLSLWRKAINFGPSGNAQTRDEALDIAARTVRARSIGRFVDVSCDSTLPVIAADFCNRLIQELNRDNLRSQLSSATSDDERLADQLQELQTKLLRQDGEVHAYTKAVHLIVAVDGSDADEIRLTELQRELSLAQADRFIKQSAYEVASSRTGVRPSAVADNPSNESPDTLTMLKARLAQLSVTFTENHPEVKRIQVQIDAIEASLDAARIDSIASSRRDFEAAQRREALLADAYDTQSRLVSTRSEHVARYNQLKRDADATRVMLETLRQRLQEANISRALEANRIRVVDSAEPATQPYQPVVWQRVVGALVFGIALGVAVAVWRERAGRMVADPPAMRYSIDVSLPNGMATVHRGRASRLRGPASYGRSLIAQPSLGNVADGDSIELMSWITKTSIIAESFRATLASIIFSKRGGGQAGVYVVASGNREEGRTTVVSNLGIALADHNQTVLVIDADLRQPRLHAVFNIYNRWGLSELLMSKAIVDGPQLSASCLPTFVPGLFVMTSGHAYKDASGALQSPRLLELIEIARKQFDTILVDTPPMLDGTDAQRLARIGDALILVVRSDTKSDVAVSAASALVGDEAQILGPIRTFSTAGFRHADNVEASADFDEADGRSDGHRVGSVDDPAERSEGESTLTSATVRTSRTLAIEGWLDSERGA